LKIYFLPRVICLSASAPFFLGVSLATAAFLFWSGEALGADKIATWEFLSENSTVGKYKASIAYEQARFDNGCFVFLVRKSDYQQLYVLNPENKAYIKRSTEVKAEPHATHLPFKKLKFINTEVIAGIKCSHYLCSCDSPLVHAEYWATQEIKVNPEIAIGCCRFSNAPTGYGLPIKLIEKLEIPGQPPRYNTRIKVLKAQKLTREPQFFQIPSDYKLVKDQLTLVSSDNGKLDADGIFFHTNDAGVLFNRQGAKR
jgi:hypothetical protein